MNIFQPGKIGKLRIKNRVIMSPMNVGGNNESDGCLSQRGVDYFVERAKGGTGMIVTGAVRVTREFERDNTVIPVWMLFADHMVHGKWISQLSERCHDYGTKVCIQITLGGGRIAGSYAQNHGLAIGPSPNPCLIAPHNYTRPLTKEEIKKMLVAVEQASRLIKNAGADAIQIHGHQGYLIDQFSTSLWNHRTDEYGGCLENRLRLAKELIESIKRGAGNDFPVIYRYGLTHYLEGGRTIEEGVEMAKLLEKFGADALDIDSGCYENNYYPHPPTTIPCGSFAYLAENVKNAVSIPVVSSTRIGYPEIAESIISKGQADFVSLGRPLIADPEWCNKAKQNQIEEIRPCIACHEGCLRRLMLYKSTSCAVNPLAGEENYLRLEKSNNPKKILIIGGGISGMVAAITCSRRGHRVSLFEKSSELGGNFQERYIPSFKSDYKKYIQYLKNNIGNTDTEIHYNTSLNINDVHKFINEDWVVVNATGASFKRIKIDGLNDSNVLSPFSLYEKKDFQGGSIAIVGGGLVGVEAAINVAMNNGKPFIIEKFDQLARTAYSVNRQHLLVLLSEYNVPTYLNTDIVRVKDNLLYCSQQETEISIPFDSISICAGMSPRNEDISDIPDVITLGDAENVSNVMNAVWTAYRKCRLI